MGDSLNMTIQPGFNGSLCVEGRPESLTAHGGLVLLRVLDDRLGVSSSLADSLVDQGAPARVRHPMSQMLRTAIYGMAIDSLGSAASADMGTDAAFRMTTSDKRGLSMLSDNASVASQPILSRFLAQLGSEENLLLLRRSLFGSAARALHASHCGKLEQIALDIDSYPIPVHGHQAGSEHDGCYRTRCYHPLGVMLGGTGHWLDLKLRSGNVHTADGAEEVLLPLVERVRESLADKVSVRGAAALRGTGSAGCTRRCECAVRVAFGHEQGPQGSRGDPRATGAGSSARVRRDHLSRDPVPRPWDHGEAHRRVPVRHRWQPQQHEPQREGLKAKARRAPPRNAHRSGACKRGCAQPSRPGIRPSEHLSRARRGLQVHRRSA